jgi:hypothetical protein
LEVTIKRVKMIFENKIPDREQKILALCKAIKDGVDSGVAKDFNPKKDLEILKKRKREIRIK